LKQGILYGVSVGPGDPELLTLKAVKTLTNCPVIATPQTAGEKTLALDIAAGAVDLSAKEILALDFPMTRDHEKLRQSHRLAADAIAARLDQGQDVAMVNLGDVSVYSTFAYLMSLLKGDGYEVVMIPGVTSFCAVAAALGESLTTMHQPVHIFPASSGPTGEALTLKGTKVLMKTGRSMPEVRAAIESAGLKDKAMLVQNCGLPGEKICRSLDEASDDISYFTTIIVKE
jgi:precorrin-2/cobalt-factor-2 C20-methyltransferase